MNQSIYPMGGGERAFPIYLAGIGLTDRENHNFRPDGYFYPQFIYTTRGKGCLIFDGKEHIITKDYCFFLPSNYPHEYYPLGDLWETHWITFNGSAVRTMLTNTGFSSPIVKKVSDGSKLESLFKKMFVTLKTDKSFGNYTCCGLVYEYIIEVYRLFFEIDSQGKNERSRILMPVLNYIEDNLERDITLDDLCVVAEVSPQHLCRVFKEIMKMRPIEYASKKRIQRAKELLEDESLSIAEVSTLVGYPNPSYFGAVFKRYEYQSPTEYRKMRLKNQPTYERSREE